MRCYWLMLHSLGRNNSTKTKELQSEKIFPAAKLNSHWNPCKCFHQLQGELDLSLSRRQPINGWDFCVSHLCVQPNLAPFSNGSFVLSVMFIWGALSFYHLNTSVASHAGLWQQHRTFCSNGNSFVPSYQRLLISTTFHHRICALPFDIAHRHEKGGGRQKTLSACKGILLDGSKINTCPDSLPREDTQEEGCSPGCSSNSLAASWPLPLSLTGNSVQPATEEQGAWKKMSGNHTAKRAFKAIMQHPAVTWCLKEQKQRSYATTFVDPDIKKVIHP